MQSAFDSPVLPDSIAKVFCLVREHRTAAHAMDFVNALRAAMHH